MSGDGSDHDPEHGRDRRLFGLLAIALVIGLAVLLAYAMNTLNHADRCLLARGVDCG